MKLKRGKGIEASPLAVLMGADYDGEDKPNADPLAELISSASDDEPVNVSDADVAAEVSDAASGSDGASSSD
jgi:hypothetical protein